jgi:tetratricopeptide (TPR) repeat protein
MFGRRKFEALMAEALHGGLSDKDTGRLESHLARKPEARTEYETLREFIISIPKDPVEPPMDLLPGVRARLDAYRPSRWRRAAPAGIGVAIAAASIAVALIPYSSPEAPPVQTSSIMGHLAEADALAYQKKYATAAEVLRTAVAASPSDPMAVRAQVRLAEMANRQQALADRRFETPGRYAAAYEAYRTLQRSFPKTFASNAQNVQRLDLLDEARHVRYASLERLDAARRKRTGVVEALEEVIAAYPSAPGSSAPSLVASLAAEEMVNHLAQDADIADSPAPKLKALETARAQCSHPLALAQIEVAIGRYHLEDRGDPTAARRWAEQALERPDPMAVALAQDFLAQLPGAEKQGTP